MSLKRAMRFMMFGAVLCAATVATAQPRPCAGDIGKFCKDVPSGSGKVRDCLAQHIKELSSACRARVERRTAAAEKRNLCAADVEKFCKDVQRGAGRVRRCLKQHVADLSDACKNQLSQGKQP
ncbi:MAG: hypothetical protein HY270_01225 [Deltaproteobacteria bacterium]|nr:hypothetical protein [Deltaproteobacteria bacterium]